MKMSGFDPFDPFDLNGDGVVDGSDAFLFNELFGEDDDLDDEDDDEYD